ncbi:Uncharacterised protein [Legionella feeleii]|uniref:Uncharacterized protein n=1 Tax=Legionella feeleii TaxID=453 RepID=A0A378KN75_9GAMM|nr:Uncharacterised protein [Legionella feeleii]
MSHHAIDNLSSPEARGKRVRFVREHLLSLTREEFCLNTNITAPSLKGWELAWGGGLSRQGAEKLVNRFRSLNVYCTESWLMHGVGRSAALITKDLDIQAGDENHIAKELLLFREIKDSIDTVIKDDSMLPFLYPGNYVGGIIVNNIENAIGKECIIVTDNNELLVRVLKHGDEPKHYNLVCLNEKTTLVKKEIKNTAIQFAAPIVWIRRIFRES